MAFFVELMTGVVEALPRPVLETHEKCANQQRLVILLKYLIRRLNATLHSLLPSHLHDLTRQDLSLRIYQRNHITVDHEIHGGVRRMVIGL